MKDILDKLSSYNLFNYLFPGVIFAILASKVTSYNLIQPDIVLGVFVYYFIGLVISRFGSLVIEPSLIRLSILKFADYEAFILASESDGKIETLSEVNNMYRTLCSLFTLVFALKLYEKVKSALPLLRQWDTVILATLLLIMFVLSYIKQTNYISKRVRARTGA